MDAVLVDMAWKADSGDRNSTKRHNQLVKFIKWRMFPLIVGYTSSACPVFKWFLGDDHGLVSEKDYTVQHVTDCEGEDSNTAYSVEPAAAADSSSEGEEDEAEGLCYESCRHETGCYQGKILTGPDPWLPRRRYLCALLQHFTRENFPGVSFGMVLFSYIILRLHRILLILSHIADCITYCCRYHILITSLTSDCINCLVPLREARQAQLAAPWGLVDPQVEYMAELTEGQRQTKQACYDRIYDTWRSCQSRLFYRVQFYAYRTCRSQALGAIDPSDTGCWEPQQPAGIRNFGNTCYLNTALQAIAPMLAEAACVVSWVPSGERESLATRSYSCLRDATIHSFPFSNIRMSSSVMSSRIFHDYVDRKIRTQSAMNEDLHTVVTRLHEWEDWPGEIKNDGTGGGCTVQELVDHHFRDDIVTDYYCSQCCEGAARRTVTQRREIIQEEGPVWLAIAVARVCLQGYAQRKVVREVKVSSIVNIPVTNQAGTVQITPYQVAALGNHEGSGSAAGHYVVYTSMPVRGFESLRTMYLRLIVLKRMVNAQPASLLVYNRKQPLSSNLIMSAQTSSPVVGLSNSGGAGGASGSPSQFIPRSRSSLVLPTSGTLKSLNTPPRTGSKACEMGNSSVSASLTSQAEEEPGRLHSDHACSSAKACVESKRVRRTIVQEREWSDALHDYDSIPKTNADTVREQRGVLELLKFAKLSECNLKIMESPSQARVSVLNDARDNLMCDIHKNREYYYVTCRVPKPRKEAQVKPKAMMLRRQRIAKAKAIVGQLLGFHGCRGGVHAPVHEPERPVNVQACR
eukprot:g75412.t1